ncbi:hypothetical protein [Microbacterium amylolyticum]|uniref:TrbL/VirB6 plasmid conjugal transfer protein n=1 Tax=Microbacterium amylolyticum TaxID=936337 RepID=A0ABS4ZLM6_9MICO|nr:hypothetical protein [Microbacterium amylolyticum]MBP2437903.1 hypothetical protein [Microbacterium amylolyticum]
MNEGTARLMLGGIVGLGDFSADVIVNAFDKPISNADWGVAFDQWGMWAGAMILFVAIVMLYQIGIGVIMQNRRRIGAAVLGGVLAVPIAALAVVMMARLVSAVDGTSQRVLETIQGGEMGLALIQTLGLNPDLGEFEKDSAVHAMVTDTIAAQSIAGFLPALVLTLLMMIAGMFLDMAMSFRTIALLILAALAPIALMMIGQGKLSAWAEKWFVLVAGLILMKPLVIGIIALVIGLSSSGGGRTFSELLVSVLIIFFCAFAPFWVVKLIDFTGSEVGSAMANRPSMRAGGARVSSVSNNRMTKAITSAMSRVFRRGK